MQKLVRVKLSAEAYVREEFHKQMEMDMMYGAEMGMMVGEEPNQ